MTRAEIADLSKCVLDQAEAGDAEAVQLVERASCDLADMVVVATRRLSLQTPPLALAGGMLGASSLLRESLLMQIEALVGPVAFVEEPVRGAIILAQRLGQSPHVSKVEHV
jgi:N-acetylglucosamine kinase-like BadF-type ATPase